MWSTPWSSRAQPTIGYEPLAPSTALSVGVSMYPKGAWLTELSTITETGPSVNTLPEDSVTRTVIECVPFDSDLV